MAMQQEPSSVLVLDADGVVLHAGGFRALLAERYGLRSADTRNFFTGPFREALRGQADVLELLPPFLADWQVPLSPGAFLATWLAADHRPDHGLLDVVDGIRAGGCPVVLASNQEQHRARHLQAAPELAGRFDAMHFSCDVGACKPDVAFYLALQERLGVEGGQVTFLDDDADNVAAAQSLGWRAAVYTGLDQVRL